MAYGGGYIDPNATLVKYARPRGTKRLKVLEIGA
jgi:hypothetical protein